MNKNEKLIVSLLIIIQKCLKLKKKLLGVIIYVLGIEVYREVDLWVVYGFLKGGKGWVRYLLNKVNIFMLMIIFIKLLIYFVI